MLLWTAENNPGSAGGALGPYPPAVTDFLTVAAESAAADKDTAPYGTSLLTAYPEAATTAMAVGSGVADQRTALATASLPPVTAAEASMIGAGLDPATTTISGSNQVTDPGMGNHTIQFVAGTSADTLVLHKDGLDLVSGFDLGTDVLDLRSLLTGTGLNLNGDISALGNYLNVVDQGSDALLRFDLQGQGDGSTVAVLQGLGSAVTSLDMLAVHGAIRIA